MPGGGADNGDGFGAHSGGVMTVAFSGPPSVLAWWAVSCVQLLPLLDWWVEGRSASLQSCHVEQQQLCNCYI